MGERKVEDESVPAVSTESCRGVLPASGSLGLAPCLTSSCVFWTIDQIRD